MTIPRLLDGLRVVEIGDGVAGGVAAGMLARLGAAVTTFVPEKRARAGHRPTVRTRTGETGALDVTLDLGKRVVVETDRELHAALAEADIVFEDAVGTGIVRPSTSGSVRVVITAFGASGPRSGQPGGELVAQAAGGLLGTIEPEGGGRPSAAPGNVALRATGHVAALAAIHGLDLHRGEDAQIVLDVSAQEAVIATAALPECGHVLFRCPGKAGSGRYLAPSGLFPCADGFVRITAVEDHQWQGMVAAMGAPSWTVGLETRSSRIDHADLITRLVEAWTATQEKDVCVDVLQGRGVPATAVAEPADVVGSPQRIHRGTLESITVDGTEIRFPGPPWTISASDHTGATSFGRLAGLRVLELTHVLAGPIVGALLGAMGADVVRAEDLARLDIYRRTGPFADGEPGTERGAYFAVANHSKRSVVGEGEELRATVHTLLGRSDVLIENVGGSRLERLGVDPAALADAGVLSLRVSGFGSTGPMANHRAYANNVQAAGGLAWLTRDHQGRFAKLGTVLADPLSSVIGATVIAAWALGPARGTGGVIDLAMSEVVSTVVSEFMAAASTGPVEPPVGADHHPHAPHGVYAAEDERWVAVAVESDDEWAALVDVLGSPPDLDRPEWSQADARYEDRRAIDDALAAIVGATPSAELADRLVEVGIRAAVVVRGTDLVEEPHLLEREFFPAYEHPEIADARLVGLPWRRMGDAPFELGAPPLLGSSIEKEPESHRVRR